jgi:predicted ester cyclase
MTKDKLASVYRDYIVCLNTREWASLGHFVSEEVVHNSKRLGVIGYRKMLEENFREIPDLYFKVDLLVVEPPYVACRLGFCCAPTDRFLGINVNGRTISFAENVFYHFKDSKIIEVWSVIDKTAIEAQLHAELNSPILTTRSSRAIDTH